MFNKKTHGPGTWESGQEWRLRFGFHPKGNPKDEILSERIQNMKGKQGSLMFKSERGEKMTK